MTNRAPLELARRPQFDEQPFDSGVDAEESVLSAMLMDAAAIGEVRALDLRADDFAVENRRIVFRGILALDECGTSVDPLTLCTELNGSLESVGGKDYISWLVDVVPTAANVRHHAELVLNNAKRRQLAGILEDHARALREGKGLPAAIAERLRPALDVIAGSRSTSLLLDDEELMAVEAPPPLVEGILPSNSLGQIFGASGAFKSFVAVDLSCHVASGLDWHGHRVRRGPVVYICAEGGFGMKHRIAAWKKYYGFTGKLGTYFFLSRVAITPEQSEIAALIRAIRVKLQVPPVLIFLDTKARNYVGNENAAEAENAFVAGCDLLRTEFGACVLVVHHTGWELLDRGRGSSAAYGALDTEIQCTRDGERLTLRCTKQKDDAEFPELAFEVIPVHKSLVLKPMDKAGGKLDGNRLLCLQAVHRLERGATYQQWKKEAGLEKKNSSFAATRDWLLTQAYVKLGAEKKYGITDAGRMALGPLSIASPQLVHPAEATGCPSRGGLEDPTMDQRQLEGVA